MGQCFFWWLGNVITQSINRRNAAQICLPLPGKKKKKTSADVVGRHGQTDICYQPQGSVSIPALLLNQESCGLKCSLGLLLAEMQVFDCEPLPRAMVQPVHMQPVRLWFEQISCVHHFGAEL